MFSEHLVQNGDEFNVCVALVEKQRQSGLKRELDLDAEGGDLLGAWGKIAVEVQAALSIAATTSYFFVGTNGDDQLLQLRHTHRIGFFSPLNNDFASCGWTPAVQKSPTESLVPLPCSAEDVAEEDHSLQIRNASREVRRLVPVTTIPRTFARYERSNTAGRAAMSCA